MTAKALAEELMKHPMFEVNFRSGDHYEIYEDLVIDDIKYKEGQFILEGYKVER